MSIWNFFLLYCGCVFDGCTLEVTWAKPPDAQKVRSPTDKRVSTHNLYKHLNFDSLDGSFDNGLSPGSSSYPLLSRSNLKSRLPLSSIPNFKSPFTITRPIQLLNYICLENGWGEPVYNVSCIESDPSELFFVCSVVIPGFPPMARKFMSDKVCHSPDEAKYNAACYVLRKLSITDVDSPVFSPSNIVSKNSVAGSLFAEKTIGNLDFISPQKSSPIPPYKAPSFLNERGQGDCGWPLNGSSSDDLENCPPLLDPNTPIEPNSILGLLASVAAASNVDLPIFNKPKL